MTDKIAAERVLVEQRELPEDRLLMRALGQGQAPLQELPLGVPRAAPLGAQQ